MSDLHADDIPFDPPPFSFQRPDRPLTCPEVWTLTELESFLDGLDSAERAGFVRDLQQERHQYAATLMAALDALHASVTVNERLLRRLRQFMGVPDDSAR